MRTRGNEEQIWRRMGEITVDPRPSVKLHESRIRWNTSESLRLNKKEYDYFEKFFPQTSLIDAVYHTNVELRKGRHGKETTLGELVKYLGLRLHMTLEPIKGGIDMYFCKKRSVDNVLKGKDFESEYGMSKSRFLRLSTCLRFNEKRVLTPDMVRITKYDCY